MSTFKVSVTQKSLKLDGGFLPYNLTLHAEFNRDLPCSPNLQVALLAETGFFLFHTHAHTHTRETLHCNSVSFDKRVLFYTSEEKTDAYLQKYMQSVKRNHGL